MADIETTAQAAQPSDKPHVRKRDIIEVKPERDSANDIRNALLVVCTLIAAATFAAGVNPPGGVWQDSYNSHVAGKSVLASYSKYSFTMFLFSNSAAFSSSTMVIILLVCNFPFYLEIWIAMAGMTFTYGVSISSVSPTGNIKSRYIYIALALPYILRATVEVLKRTRKFIAKTK
ncbi:hypothetical protein ACLB2K_066495 [Fragaria x ananassa]